MSPAEKETEQVRSPQTMLKETGDQHLVTGDNWLLYLMLLLTQTPQLEHLPVSEADEDRWLLPRLWRDRVTRRLEQWTGVDKDFPKGQPRSRCEVALEERNRWAVSSPKPLDCVCPGQTAWCSAGAFERDVVLQSFFYPGDRCIDCAWPLKGCISV